MTDAGGSPCEDLDRALLLLAPAVTIVVATEFIVVGLLPLIARDFDISLARAGTLTGWWAFSAAVAGPFVTLVTNRLPPRTLLIAALLLFTAGNAVMTLADNFDLMLVTRIIQGAVLPAIVSVVASVVARLAPRSEQGRGLARANIGFVLGVLLVLPAGVAIADSGDWRLPFAVLAVVALPAAAAISRYFPVVSATRAGTMIEQLGLLRRPVFLAHLGLSVVFFAAMFAAYTYLGAWIEQAMGLSAGWSALLLFLFGAAGLAGNAAAGRIADATPLGGAIVAAVILVASIKLAVVASGSMALATILLMIWGGSHTVLVILCQVRVTLAGQAAPAFAMTMNISAANLGIAIGAFGGGVFIERQGVEAIGIAALGFALLAAPLLWLVRPAARSEGAGRLR